MNRPSIKSMFQLPGPFLVGLLLLFYSSACTPQSEESYPPSDIGTIAFTVTPDTQSRVFHMEIRLDSILMDTMNLKLPVWTPGYYQIMNYAKNISNFQVMDDVSENIRWEQINDNTWRIFSNFKPKVRVQYEVKTERSFVANSFMDPDRAYITPAGVFMHVEGMLDHPVGITIHVPNGNIATGLSQVEDIRNQFTAEDFDILYDCPILMGKLEELEPFEIEGIPHRFIGYQMGDFDREAFMVDLKKIVQEGVKVIGDIPYNQYTFLAIGPGRGGIEHLNSTAFGFNGRGLNSREGKLRLYTFLAHEYFHHYNVKRIRPIELGPFDYDRENRTNMLWVSEGITVYYDLMLVRRAGLMTREELFGELQTRLRAYETDPGRIHQSATEASYNTWSDGPFGQSGVEEDRTISVYDKGTILGLLLDFKIRELTQNQKDLDDVMRTLYQEFYLEKGRGFTEEEFREVCEGIASGDLTEVFEYASTTNPLDYEKYFDYAGLDIDTKPRLVPGGWLGMGSRRRQDSLFVTTVEYESPAWDSGIRRGMVILEIGIGNNEDAVQSLQPILEGHKPGDKVILKALNGDKTIADFTFELGEKIEPTFEIRLQENPGELQKRILEDWGGN